MDVKSGRAPVESDAHAADVEASKPTYPGKAQKVSGSGVPKPETLNHEETNKKN